MQGRTLALSAIPPRPHPHQVVVRRGGKTGLPTHAGPFGLLLGPDGVESHAIQIGTDRTAPHEVSHRIDPTDLGLRGGITIAAAAEAEPGVVVNGSCGVCALAEATVGIDVTDGAISPV